MWINQYFLSFKLFKFFKFFPKKYIFIKVDNYINAYLKRNEYFFTSKNSLNLWTPGSGAKRI